MQTVKNLLSLYPEVLSNKIPLIISKLFSLATPAAWGLRPFWRPPLLSPAYVTVTWNTSVEKKLLMMTMMMVKVAVIWLTCVYRKLYKKGRLVEAYSCGTEALKIHSGHERANQFVAKIRDIVCKFLHCCGLWIFLICTAAKICQKLQNSEFRLKQHVGCVTFLRKTLMMVDRYYYWKSPCGPLGPKLFACVVCDLGMYIDSDVSMRSNVTKTVSACFASLRELWSVRRSAPRSVLQSLVSSLVLTQLDYGNGSLVGILV